MKLSGIVVAAAGLCLMATVPANAAPVVLQSLSPSLTVGGSNLATAGTQNDTWTVAEGFSNTGPVVLQFSDVDGVPLANGVAGFSSGSWISATITNNSGTDWTSFEFELQKTLGTASNELDGLSFAQRGGFAFTSTVFSKVSRIDTTRDYLNFSDGVVKAGSSVSFLFAVTDMTPVSNPFYLVQIANRQDRAIPEPATLTLFGTGLVGFLARRRRRS